MSDRVNEDRGLVRRHSLTELVEHWALALSGIILIISGLLELPIGRRYYITEIPGFSWAGDFFITLSIHYAAAVVFVAVAIFHIFYHGLIGHQGLVPRRGDLKASVAVMKSFFGKGEEPPFHKYLPEQRLAYAGMVFIVGMLIISGLVKTYVNLINPQLAYPVVLAATWIHNIFFVIFVLAFIAHIGALAIKANRSLVRGIFTGSVRLDYARQRHPLWLEEIEPPPAVIKKNGLLEETGTLDEQGEDGSIDKDTHAQQEQPGDAEDEGASADQCITEPEESKKEEKQ